MKLAVGVITWQDGLDNLDAALTSCKPAGYDLAIVCDGVIDGVDQQGLPDLTAELGEVHSDGLVVVSRRWPSQSVKRDWLLSCAKVEGCDWLLQIDADERLHNAQLLRPFLDGYAADAFPIPFEVDPGVMLGASWKCLRVDAWDAVVSGGAYLRHRDGNVYCVTPPGNAAPGVERFDNLEAYRRIAPWLSHHPDLRPEGRRQIRLGEVEHLLEPPPHVDSYLTPSLHARPLLQSAAVSDTNIEAGGDAAAATETAAWACPQCGNRYVSPGICEQGHAPAEVVAIAPDTAATDAADAAATDAAATDVPPPDNATPTETADAPPADAATTDATPADTAAATDTSSADTPAPVELEPFVIFAVTADGFAKGAAISVDTDGSLNYCSPAGTITKLAEG